MLWTPSGSVALIEIVTLCAAGWLLDRLRELPQLGSGVCGEHRVLRPGVGGPAVSPGMLSSTLNDRSLLPMLVFSTWTAIVLTPSSRYELALVSVTSSQLASCD